MQKEPTADTLPVANEKKPLPRFHLVELFPEAGSVFTLSTPPLESVRDSALVVLDTNALVIPYTIQQKSLDEIKTAYKALIDTGRLVIPAQVAREFGRVRAIKIQELFQSTSRKQNVVNVKVERYPLLDSIDEYSALLEQEKELNEKIDQYRRAVRPVLDAIRGWNRDDPVSLIYRELFHPAIVIEASASQAQLEEDFQRRVANRIPPGYKDGAKDDGGIGDIIIWNTILDLGREKGLPLIFVTGEEKPDWMVRSENQALSPRFELVDEYARASGGQPLYLLKLHELLDFAGVQQEVVAEVKKEEAEAQPQRYVDGTSKLDVDSYRTFRGLVECAERAVKKWIASLYPGCPIDESRGFPDLTVTLSRSRRIGVEIKFVRASNVFHAKRFLNDLSYRAFYEQSTGGFERIAIVIVFADREAAFEYIDRFTRVSDVGPDVLAVIGYLDDETEFIPLLDELSGNV